MIGKPKHNLQLNKIVILVVCPFLSHFTFVLELCLVGNPNPQQL